MHSDIICTSGLFGGAKFWVKLLFARNVVSIVVSSKRLLRSFDGRFENQSFCCWNLALWHNAQHVFDLSSVILMVYTGWNYFAQCRVLFSHLTVCSCSLLHPSHRREKRCRCLAHPSGAPALHLVCTKAALEPSCCKLVPSSAGQASSQA